MDDIGQMCALMSCTNDATRISKSLFGDDGIKCCLKCAKKRQMYGMSHVAISDEPTEDRTRKTRSFEGLVGDKPTERDAI